MSTCKTEKYRTPCGKDLSETAAGLCKGEGKATARWQAGEEEEKKEEGGADLHQARAKMQEKAALSEK